jgi:hypothetical protein
VDIGHFNNFNVIEATCFENGYMSSINTYFSAVIWQLIWLIFLLQGLQYLYLFILTVNDILSIYKNSPLKFLIFKN